MTTTTAEADRAQDTALAVTDAQITLAAFEELADLIRADRHDAANVQDIATDVLPRLKALTDFILEQVVEVTR